MRVLCAAYRLAPENPYPAAVEDALETYRYILDKGYRPEQIVLCGESAGEMCIRDRHCRLLFVAHREEILKPSLYTFRAVLKDAN